MTNSSDSFNLLEVVRTNDSYPIGEERLIRQCLVTAEENIQRLDRELVSLKSQVFRYRIALAPYKKLPADVLRYIFTLCCDKRLRIGKGNMAVILSQVSFAWRHLVFQMPHIWAHVDFDLPYIDVQKLSLARQWLSHAENLPRALRISEFSFHFWSANDAVQQLIAAYPYQRLDLCLPWDQLTLMNVPATQLASLEYLDLRCPSHLHMNVPLPLPPLVKLPSLIHLDLQIRGEPRDIENLTLAVPWHRLKHLRLSIPIPPMLCLNTILRQGTQLTHCVLLLTQDPMFTSMSTAFVDPVVLPKMILLDLICASVDDAAAFERLLVTPNAPQRDLDTEEWRLRFTAVWRFTQS